MTPPWYNYFPPSTNPTECSQPRDECESDNDNKHICELEQQELHLVDITKNLQEDMLQSRKTLNDLVKKLQTLSPSTVTTNKYSTIASNVQTEPTLFDDIMRNLSEPSSKSLRKQAILGRNSDFTNKQMAPPES